MEWHTDEDGESVLYMWADILVRSGAHIDMVCQQIEMILRLQHQDVLDGTGWCEVQDDSGRQITAGTTFEVVLTSEDAVVSVRNTLLMLPDLVSGVERVELLTHRPLL